MGFYNYYRLLKEIRYLFRNKKIKKLFTIIIIFLIIIIILNNRGYCAVDNYTVEVYPTSMITPVNVDPNIMEYVRSNTGNFTYYVPIRQGFLYEVHNPSGKNLAYAYSNDIPAVGNKLVWWGVSSIPIFHLTGSNNLDGYLCLWNADGGDSSDVYLTETEGTIARNYVTAQDLQTEINYIISSLSHYDNLDTQRNNQLIQSLHTDNMAILEAINSYLYGDVEEFPISYSIINGLLANAGSFISNPYQDPFNVIYFPIVEGKNYSVNYSITANNPSVYSVRYGFTDNIPGLNVNYKSLSLWDTTQTSINFTADNSKYFYVCYSANTLSNFSVTSDYNPGQQQGIYGGLTDVNNQVVTQGQETRDTITDSDVNINENQLVTNDTNDVTEDGYDNIFEMIRTAFTGSPSAITFPIPFVNQQFTIQPDFLSHYLSVAGLSFFVTLVNAYWYFIISRFIVKKIHNIIENLKEGEFEQTTGNIKTEVF